MARKATRKAATTTGGWRKRAPKTQQERRKLRSRCGSKAFLVPKELKYPIMAKTGSCVVDCQGLRAAKSRLGAMATSASAAGRGREASKLRGLQKKTDRLGKSAGCRWA